MTSIVVLVALCYSIVSSQTTGNYRSNNEFLYSKLSSKETFPIIPKENASHVVMLNMGFYLIRLIKMDPQSLEAEIDAWVYYKWTDHHLGWSSKLGIQEMNMPLGNIWSPDIVMMESPTDMTSGGFEFNAVIQSNGNVIHVPAVKIKSMCSAETGDKDLVTCVVTLGSRTYNTKDLDLQVHKITGLDLSLFRENKKWNLEQSSVVRIEKKYDCCPHRVFPLIRYSFTFRELK